jgi:hypothetical protein
MAETSMLWTTNGTGHGVGSGYASNRWQAFLRKMFMSDQVATACVLNGVDSELAVSGTASPLSVAAGAAIDHSFFYENDAAKALAVTTPVVGLTGGRVILEANWAAQTVTALAVRNTDGVAAIPALTQVANTTWQVSLATFTITTGGVITLTDTRKKVKFSNVVYSGGFDSSAVDNTGIELSSGALRLKDLGVKTAKIDDLSVTLAKVAADAIDDTKVGNRVPQFYRRQGGNASDWSIGGVTTQTPTTIRCQFGAGVTNAFGNLDITFPVAFSNKPIMLMTPVDSGGARSCGVQSVTATTAHATVYDMAGTPQTSNTFFWIAIGPE